MDSLYNLTTDLVYMINAKYSWRLTKRFHLIFMQIHGLEMQ